MTTSLKKSIIKGTLILTIAGIIARFLGFYNRIFLCNLFGERELGIYQMVLPVYIVILSFCSQGIQTALTRQIARTGDCDFLSKKLLLKNALTLSLILSFLCSILVFTASDWISLHILHSTECRKCLQILSFAFPFVTIKGCLLGYFIGIQKSGVTAWGQLIEQIAKITGVFIVSNYILMIEPQAYFAVYGVVIGEIVSCSFMILCYIFHNKTHKNNAVQTVTDRPICPSGPITKSEINGKNSMLELIRDAVPLTTNRLSLTFLQSMESILIPHMLNIYLANGDASLILYGTLSGLVLPCIMFPTTLTSSLALMLLPAISSQHEANETDSLIRVIRKSIYFCLAIGLCSTLFLLFFGKWTGRVILSSEAAGELLFQFALLCPFIYLSACLASIMNGIGKATVNMIFSIVCIGIRIGFILWLVPILGLKGYMWGMMGSYLLQTCLLLCSIRRSFRT